MTNVQDLITEFDTALDKASVLRRTAILRQVLDLFVAHADLYDGDQIAVFELITSLLIGKVERLAVIELSKRLAAVDQAPAGIINQLSCDDDIAIAGPVLETSKAVGDGDVLKIAESKSPAHLLAIAGRPAIDTVTTDVLINRGSPDVLRKLAGNEGASFSETGYVRLITKAQQDAVLAQSISKRADVPDELKSFLQLALG